MITGMSGAGRSQAADGLEDQGWFVVDNLPTALIDKVAELAVQPGAQQQRLALVVGRADDDLHDAIRRLRTSGHRVRILFLDASDAELVKRYGETRRRHPMASSSVTVQEAVVLERTRLESIRAAADLVVDTTGQSIYALKAKLASQFAGENDQSADMQVTIVSFGFKHGIPLDVDMIFDVRFLRNPFWVDELRAQSGLDDEVRKYVLDSEMAQAFLASVTGLLGLTLPAHEQEGRSYVTVGIGCTGGRHRSVAVSEELAARLRAVGRAPRVRHRDLEASGPA